MEEREGVRQWVVGKLQALLSWAPHEVNGSELKLSNGENTNT